MRSNYAVSLACMGRECCSSSKNVLCPSSTFENEVSGFLSCGMLSLLGQENPTSQGGLFFCEIHMDVL